MELLVDSFGRELISPPVPAAAQPVEAVGVRRAVPIASRILWASMSGRYQPSHPPGEICLFGMDFSFILPVGVGIRFAELNIFNNTFLSPDVSADWMIDPVTISGRRVWTRLAGGVEGQDYRLAWLVSDSNYNVYPRSALVLCSQTN